MFLYFYFSWIFPYLIGYITGILISKKIFLLASIFVFIGFFILNKSKNTIFLFFGFIFYAHYITNRILLSIKTKQQIILDSICSIGYAISSNEISEKNFQTVFFLKKIYKKNCSRKINKSILISSSFKINLYQLASIRHILFKPSEELSDYFEQYELVGSGALTKINYIESASFFSILINKISNYRIEVLKKIYNYLPNGKDLFSTILLNQPKKKSVSIDSRTNELRNIFNKWGISHYLARSGLHIILILQLIMAVVSLLNLSFKITSGISNIILLLFSIYSYGGLSFLRALLMWIFFLISNFLYISSNTLHTFSLCAFFLLIINPFFLFRIDFQLSFGATFALLLFFRAKKIHSGGLSIL